MSYGMSTTLQRPFGEVVDAVRAALAEQGFGVLTEIDVQATFKQKLDADVDPYLILGACNPTLAHRSLQVDPTLGLLLPCNVVVRATGEATVVEIVDPTIMVALSDDPALKPVADEAAQRLRTVLTTLSS